MALMDSLPQNSADWHSLQRRAQRKLVDQRLATLPEWTEAVRLIGGRAMELTPLMRDLYGNAHDFLVIKKASQVGISEFLLNTGLYAADQGHGRGNVLHLMPTNNIMLDFTQGRIEPAIAQSAYLKARLVGPDRTGLKGLGEGRLYLHGAESINDVSSLDIDCLNLDEYDRMHAGVLELALQRLASSTDPWIRVASTPTAAGVGIDRLFEESDQRYPYLPCPRCGRLQRLRWPDSVDREQAMRVCERPACRAPMNLWLPGEWRATYPERGRIHGYHLNRLYSPFANLKQIVLAAELGEWSDEQAFANGVLGEVYEPEDAQLTRADVQANVSTAALDTYAGQPCLMGVDPGKQLAVVVRDAADGRLWWAARCSGYDELDALMTRFHVEACVIDNGSYGHAELEFAQRHGTRVWLADYSRRGPGPEFVRGKGRLPNQVHLNRTDAFDALAQAFKQGKRPLPADPLPVGADPREHEYITQVLAPRRAQVQDGHGDRVWRWDSGNRSDHFAHAEVLCLFADQRPRRAKRSITIRAMPDLHDRHLGQRIIRDAFRL